MRIPRHPTSRRSGISLMEVLVSLTIFLLSLAALSELISFGRDRAIDIEVQSLAARLCQSKLAEVTAGAELLETQFDVPFDEYPNATWSVEVSEGAFPGLWNVMVMVNVTRIATTAEVRLHQMVLDPTLKGSTQDQKVITGEDDDTENTEDPEGEGEGN